MAYCGACGKPEDGAATAPSHAQCAALLAFDPPRFCEIDGFRLDVQVFPDGYRTACRECRRQGRTPPRPAGR